MPSQMNAQPCSQVSQIPDSRQIRAILELIDDEDPRVYAAIKKHILRAGPLVVPLLIRYLQNENKLVRLRARRLLHRISQQQAEADFLTFCKSAPQFLDLEKALLLLSRTTYPEINIEGYEAVLDEIEEQLTRQLRVCNSGLTVATELSNFIFHSLGIQAVPISSAEEDDFYLCKLIDRRTGHPALICCLYIILANRAQLPIAPIELGRHIVCRFQSTIDSIYIDPANRGLLMTRHDCAQYLRQMGISSAAPNLKPLTPKELLERICELLSRFYYERDRKADSLRLLQYASALRKQRARG